MKYQFPSKLARYFFEFILFSLGFKTYYTHLGKSFLLQELFVDRKRINTKMLSSTCEVKFLKKYVPKKVGKNVHYIKFF